jgi:hypothetical protein
MAPVSPPLPLSLGGGLAYGVKSIRSKKKYLNINLIDLISILSLYLEYYIYYFLFYRWIFLDFCNIYSNYRQ